MSDTPRVDAELDAIARGHVNPDEKYVRAIRIGKALERELADYKSAGNLWAKKCDRRDKRIAELEAENAKLKTQIDDKENFIAEAGEIMDQAMLDIDKLIAEANHWEGQAKVLDVTAKHMLGRVKELEADAARKKGDWK